jgi:hypothetical protein
MMRVNITHHRQAERGRLSSAGSMLAMLFVVVLLSVISWRAASAQRRQVMKYSVVFSDSTDITTFEKMRFFGRPSSRRPLGLQFWSSLFSMPRR